MPPNAPRLYCIYQNIQLHYRVRFYNFRIRTLNIPVSKYLSFDRTDETGGIDAEGDSGEEGPQHRQHDDKAQQDE